MLRLKQDKHYARNEARSSLEDDSFNDWSGRNSSGWYKALRACVTCDSSKPAMAALLKENDAEVQKALATPAPQEKVHNYRANAREE
ncbi:MAG: hypothetical protein AABX31_01780 [Nanoarchaeota archaeon]